MQISAANLLATQSQGSVRTRGTATAFEPIAFKEAPAAPSVQRAAPEAPAPASRPAAQVAATATAPAPGGYLRPGSTLDIKI